MAKDTDNRQWIDKGSTSNPRIVGVERSSSVIAELIGRCTHEFPDAIEFFVCAGIAGAATTPMQKALTASLKQELKNRSRVSIEITDDATIAYEAAFAGDHGVLFLVGTGSMVLVRTMDGTFVRSGGWGYLLGDEGSGYSIGRAGMRAVAASLDANKTTPLTTRAAADLDVSTRDSLIDTVYGLDYSLAKFAPAVLEESCKGDIQSKEIVEDEIRKLVDRLCALIELNALDVTGAVKTTGGLSRSRPYMLSLANVIQERFPEWKVTRSGREPVEGALWMATRMSTRTSN